MSELLENIRKEASRRRQRIVYPHPEEAKVLEAVAVISESGLARPVLIGERSRLGKLGVAVKLNLAKVEIIDRDSRKMPQYAEMRLAGWKAQGVRGVEARVRLEDPVEYAVAMVVAGDADGVVAGPVSGQSRDRMASAESTGLAAARSLFSRCFLVLSREAGKQPGCLFADPVTAGDPSAEQLAEAAIGAAARTRGLLDREPHIAFITLTTAASLQPRNRFTSVEEALRERVSGAIATVRARNEFLKIEPVLWNGTGTGSEQTGEMKPEGPNTFVFVQNQAGGLGRRLGRMFARARTIGPLFDGLSQPVNELEVGCSAEDVVDITAITALGEPG